MSDVVIGEGTTVNYSIIDSRVTVGAGCVIGKPRSADTSVAVVAGGLEIPDGVTIPDGAMADREFIGEIGAKEETI